METESLRIEAEVAVRQATEDREHVDALAVVTADDYRQAAEHLRALTAKYKELDERRKQATRPLDESKKAIMSWFRPAIDSLEFSIDALKARMTSYNERQVAIERQASENAAAALVAKRPVDETAMTTAFAGSVTATEGIAVAHVWDFEVTDPAKLPREYLLPDLQKIRAVVRALKAEAVIEGVRVFKTTQVKVTK